MAIERYIAAAGLGLFVMFVGEIVTLYYFMIDSPREIEPVPKLLQFISIGVAPALVMTGVSFIMSKRYGSRIHDYCRRRCHACGHGVCADAHRQD